MKLPVIVLLISFCLFSANGQITCPDRAVRGNPLLCRVHTPEKVNELSIELQNVERTIVARTKGFFLLKSSSGVCLYAAVIGLKSTLREGVYSLKVSGEGENFFFRYSTPIRVEEKSFSQETIQFDSSLTNLMKVKNPEKTRQTKELVEILNRIDTDAIYHRKFFSLPVANDRRTSGFGDIRRYAYSDGSFHYSIHGGIDFGLPEGSPVFTCASGKVVLAQDRILTGCSIVLEHLPGVYSIYYHLSCIDVLMGDLVVQGQEIGKVGQSGLATGPHLHWEVRVSGIPVDPEAFVRIPGLQKAAVDMDLLSDIQYISTY